MSIDFLQSKRANYNVIGTICKELDILREERYIINPEDFPNKTLEVIFGAIYELAYGNADLTEVTPIDIDNYLSNYPEYYKIFENGKGFEYVVRSIDTCNPKLFDKYFNELKKFSLLRMYYINGFDVRNIYNYDEEDIRKRGEEFDKLMKMSESDIVKEVSLNLIAIQEQWNVHNIMCQTAYQAGEQIDENMDALIEEGEIGLSYSSIYYNSLFLGAVRGKFLLRSADTGCVDATTEYFNGYEWKSIAEYDGGMVMQYTEDGRGELVYPTRYIKEPCEKMYKVKTKYGIDQLVSEDHSMVFIGGGRDKTPKKVPFKEFKKIHEKNVLGYGGKIPTTFKYEGKGVDLTLEEIRVMVAVIADGYFACQEGNNTCRIHVLKDRKKERIQKLLKDAKIEYDTITNHSTGYSTYKFIAPRREKEFTKYWYDCSKKQLECICDEVLYWDGSQGINNRIGKFSTTVKQSADFIQYCFTVCGYRASLSTDDNRGKVRIINGKEYIKKSIDYGVTPTTRTLPSMKSGNKTKIEEVKSTDGYKYCFTVPSGMLVLRHNNTINITGNCGKTRWFVADACEFSCSHKYDEKLGWVEIGQNSPTLFICTELDLQELQILMIAYLTGIPTRKLKLGKLTALDKGKVEKAKEIIQNAPLYIEELEDGDINDINMLINKHIMKYNIRNVIYDYIENTPKMCRSIAEMYGIASIREDQVLQNFTNFFKGFAKKFNIFVESGTQLNREPIKNANALAGGKGTARKVDFGVIVGFATDEELAKVKGHIESSGKTPNYAHWVYKNRGAGESNIVLWMNTNLGNMREEFCFATDYRFNRVEVQGMEITPTKVENKEVEEPFNPFNISSGEVDF